MIDWILGFVTDIVLPATDNVWTFLTATLDNSIPVIGGLSLLSVLAGSALVALVVYLFIRTLVL